MEKPQSPKVMVVGVGNLLLKDEGVGIHLVRALEGLVPPERGIQLVDGGTSVDVLSLLPAADKLVILDAARGGDSPGTVYRFGPEEVAAGETIVSLHQFSLGLALKTMKHIGVEPGQVVIIGIEPEEIDWGLELSPTLQRQMPRILEVVLKEVGLDRERLETGRQR